MSYPCLGFAEIGCPALAGLAEVPVGVIPEKREQNYALFPNYQYLCTSFLAAVSILIFFSLIINAKKIIKNHFP